MQRLLEGDQAAGGSQVGRRQETALEVAASPDFTKKIMGREKKKKNIREPYHLVTWGCF